jgi:hypothetical protein
MTIGTYSGPLGWQCLEVFNLEDSTTAHHVIPIDDLREHTIDGQCWCDAKGNEDEPPVWTHNSADRREEFELGRKTS